MGEDKGIVGAGRDVTVALAALVLGALLVGGAPAAVAADGQRNACGCYDDGAGNCYCDRVAKCGCPGLCEPRGCAEERQKQLDKEIDAETRRAQQLEHAADEKTKEDDAVSVPAAAPAPTPAALKTPAPRPVAHVRKLSARQQRDLYRLLELYIAGDPERREMSTDDVLKELGQPGPEVKRP